MSTELDIRRRRAIYRAAHRGTKEMDFMLGRYADARVPAMPEAELARFEQFIALPDPELQRWLMGPPPELTGGIGGLVTAIRAFHGGDR